jgi:hypothetical protein
LRWRLRRLPAAAGAVRSGSARWVGLVRIAVAVPIAQLLDEYEAQCGRYRDLVASLDLDTPSKRPVDGRPVTLRWILFHLVEETARHNGHLDILRELADGVTGT